MAVETELFVHFAEIAGVYVGFAALITVRSQRVNDLHDMVYLRGVLGMGVWVVVMALLPIAVARYGVQDHALWASCAVVGLALWAALVVAMNRGEVVRAFNRSVERVDRLFPVVGLPLHVVGAGSLLLIVLGVWRAADDALYVTALTTGVVFAGYTLLALAFSQKQVLETDREQQR